MRDGEILRLTAEHLPVELGVSEQRSAHAVFTDLRGVALGLQALGAHEARFTSDLEGDHHPVTGPQVGDAGADFFHDAHGLVAHDVALRHEGRQWLVQV